MNTQNIPLDFARIRRVSEITGLSRSSIYRREASGLLPPHVHVGATAVWATHELQAVMRGTLAGMTEDQIRELVRKIVDDRRQVSP